jgi:hypothetical protein
MPSSRPTPTVVANLRRICLRLPEATEKPFGGHEAPSFRVRDNLFLMLREDGRSFTCKAPPGDQEAVAEIRAGGDAHGSATHRRLITRTSRSP